MHWGDVNATLLARKDGIPYIEGKVKQSREGASTARNCYVAVVGVWIAGIWIMAN